MTLCIAGHCTHEGRPAMVLCADTQGTDFVKSFDTYKIRITTETHGAAMFAGTVPAAKELLAEVHQVIEHHFVDANNVDDLTVTYAMAALRNFVAGKLKGAKGNYAERCYGLSLEEFYRLADEQMRGEMRQISLGCDLLLCHVFPKLSVILHVAESGEVRWYEVYHGIGSGYWIARAMLSQSDWRGRDLTVMDAATRLRFAKQAAERDVHVGSTMTQLLVLLPGRPPQQFTEAGDERMKKLMPKMGYPVGTLTLDEYLTDV